MKTVPDLLENAAQGDGVLTILGARREDISMAELWLRAGRAAARLAGTAELRMETSLDCLISLLAAWRAGVTTVSLPPSGEPPRPLLAEPGEFVQFSSGSTGRPKGVRLASQAIATNVVAMIEHMAPYYEDAVACSWLPLAHDMGLIGTLLTILAAMGPPWQARRLVLIPPERFVARPARWLQACSEFSATVTCAPNFALELVLRHPPAGLDLRPLRVLVVGSEPLVPGTLRRFAEAFAASGFDERAFCPAYGMAEASLAVTMVRPDEHWSMGGDVVSCGAPLACFEVRAPAAEAGSIAIRGRSLFSGYVGEECSPLDEDGWFTTSDLGFVRDGHLYVVGRADDVLMIAGRKLYPDVLERAAERHEAVRVGGCAVVSDGAGGLVVVAERRGTRGGDELADACRWIRREVSASSGVSPRAVVFVSPRSIPKTASGKLQRRLLRQLRLREELPVEAEVTFAG